MTTEGIEFINAGPEAVKNYLISRRVKQLEVSPSELLVKSSGRNLRLCVLGNPGKEYPVRKTFLQKLLKWYSFPLRGTEAGSPVMLSSDTVASVCNDILLQVRSEYVIVTFEEGEALTIVSPGYSGISDLEIIAALNNSGICTISRNDFMMRITTREKYRLTPVKGDDCGVGVSIMNSETGFRSLSVQHFILRYICSNGAMAQIDEESGSRVHYRRKPGELQAFLYAQLELAEEKRNRLSESFLKLKERKASERKDIIRRMRPLLTRREARFIETASLYSVFNLITERAKKFDLAPRIYWETLAGELLNL